MIEPNALVDPYIKVHGKIVLKLEAPKSPIRMTSTLSASTNSIVKPKLVLTTTDHPGGVMFWKNAMTTFQCTKSSKSSPHSLLIVLQITYRLTQ